MPDDIEDFLKRAAQRRQAKSAQAPPPKPAPPKPAPPRPAPVAQSRPEYTSARTERIPRNHPDNEVPMQAILVDEDVVEPVSKHVSQLKRERVNATKAAEVRRAGGAVKPVAVQAYVVPERAPNVASKVSTGDNAGFTATDRLITMLRQPEGMMQAILLNEILTRPEHRW